MPRFTEMLPNAPRRGLVRGAVLLAAFLVFAGGCVTQDDMLVLLDRIVLLEQNEQVVMDRLAQIDERLNNLSGELQSQEASQLTREEGLREQIAPLRAQVDALHQQIREIQGALEETGFEFTQKVDKMQDVERKVDAVDRNLRSRIAKAEERIGELEALLGVGDQPAPAPGQAQPAAAGGEASGKLTEEQLYDLAKKTFDRGDFETSIKQFQAFLRRFPDSKNADNAIFWIGEAYFQQGWYEKAILEYHKVVTEHPNGNKVPAALLKQGMAFARIGDKTNARLVWRDLIKRFSASPEAQIAERKLKALD